MKGIALWIMLLLLIGCASPPPMRSAQTQPAMPRVPSGQAEAIEGNLGRAGAASVRGMTFEEVQVCATGALDLEATNAALSVQLKSLREREAELAAIGAAIESNRASVDATNQTAVDKFNTWIDTHRDGVRAFNESVTAHNRSIEDTHRKLRAHNVNCANRPYKSEDAARLAPEARAAWERNSSKFDLPVFFE